VVLAHGNDVEPDLFGLERDGHHRLHALRVARHPPSGRVLRDIPDGEHSELHRNRLA